MKTIADFERNNRDYYRELSPVEEKGLVQALKLDMLEKPRLVDEKILSEITSDNGEYIKKLVRVLGGLGYNISCGLLFELVPLMDNHAKMLLWFYALAKYGHDNQVWIMTVNDLVKIVPKGYPTERTYKEAWSQQADDNTDLAKANVWAKLIRPKDEVDGTV